jgi:hypothetical protein
VDRVWSRCCQAPGLTDLLATVAEPNGKRIFSRPNDRMRFLEYSPGNFFKGNCSRLLRHVNEANRVQLIATDRPDTQTTEESSRLSILLRSISTTHPSCRLRENLKEALLAFCVAIPRFALLLIPRQVAFSFSSVSVSSPRAPR